MYYRRGSILILFVLIVQLLTACEARNPQSPVEITFYKRGYTEGGDRYHLNHHCSGRAGFSSRQPSYQSQRGGRGLDARRHRPA